MVILVIGYCLPALEGGDLDLGSWNFLPAISMRSRSNHVQKKRYLLPE